MKSERIFALASFINKDARVADIGCDHAYLAIYLTKNKLCKSVVATDIHKNALESAKKNISDYKLDKNISLYLTDGLEGVPQEQLDTLVIAGMGTSTILHILEKVDKKYIKSLVLQSNHDLYTLRNNLGKLGYYLQKEKVVYENKHYYVIGLYTQNKRKLTKREKYFGIYDSSNLNYYKFLKEKIELNYKRVNLRHIKEKLSFYYQRYLLKKYL